MGQPCCTNQIEFDGEDWAKESLVTKKKHVMWKQDLVQEFTYEVDSSKKLIEQLVFESDTLLPLMFKDELEGRIAVNGEQFIAEISRAG